MKTFVSINNSTIYDVCLNTYGTLDLLTKLMVDNDFPGVNEYPENGRIFTFDETLISNEQIYNQSALSNIKYATR